ncbi:LuxR C-terminal-related transcriptional regulator, partial [Xanthomarina gelatinilytica]|uniref:LuxR C-terminal-related transcriptional regulator n=1 Tax=Xanthomarina gelatinilytica TaxID=1137281 RepID=UPI003AA9AD2C
ASYVESFYDLYKSSEHLIIAQSKIDEKGNWELFLPHKDYSYLIRLHVSKTKDPIASLIIGTKDENHCFLAIGNEDVINYVAKDSTTILNSYSSRNSFLNNRMQEITAIAKKWNELDKNTIGSDNKIVLRKNAAHELLKYADTTSFILPAIYAAHSADFGFNKAQIESSINETYNRLGEHPYLKVYPITNNTYTYFIYFILIASVPVFILAFLKSQKLYKTKKKQALINSLSIREKEVLDLVIEGKRNKEISDMLHIEVSTVKSHVNSIYSKLNIQSRKDLSQFEEL